MSPFIRRLVPAFFLNAALLLTLRASEPKAQFTDSSAAGLGTTKRVAITSVLVSFQTSTGTYAREKGSVMNLITIGKNVKQDALTVLQLPNLDPKLAAAITEQVYRQLQADLSAAGFELVPAATVQASPTYQKILKMAGTQNFTKFANKAGDVLLVGPEKLPPYLPYGIESGPFNSMPKGYIKGWVSATGKSSTPDGPSATSLQSTWGLPALEVALAKELNAHVLKATYLVSLGTTAVKIGHSFGSEYVSTFQGLGQAYTKTVSSSGDALAQPGLLPLQSRLAFRTPDGNAKWQTAPRLKDAPPAKDGDVVVTLAEPLLGSTDLFSFETSKAKSDLFHPEKADTVYRFTATLEDPAGFAAEVTGMITAAQKAMLAQVKR